MIEDKRYTDAELFCGINLMQKAKIHYLCSTETIWLSTEIDFRISVDIL